VSPEYFGVFRLAIIRGRNFTADEANSEAPVVIISEATARAFWPHQDALGQPISIAPDQRNAKTPAFRTARVIGITRDVINGLLWDGPDPAYLYFPAQAKGLQGGAVLVRVKSGSSVARRALDDVLARTSPAGVRQVNMMDDLLATQVFPFQISFAIAAFLGGLALILTLSGIYGVLSYVVTQRRKEIGIRMALGATRANVIRLVLSQSFRLAAYGIAIGSVFALAISKLVASLVVAVNTFDVLAYGGGILVVLGAAIAASFFPTRRAVRVDPASTLRYD
jgi:ABC-type antimicrobial peptide transport system permease subunit